MVDLFVIGGGPAGLAAVIQAARWGLSVRLVSDEPPGGLLRAARLVENWPGFPAGIPGSELADLLVEHACQSGVVCQEGCATTCRQVERGLEVDIVRRDGRREIVSARAVVAATGTSPRKWSVPGAEDAAQAGRLHRDVRGLADSLCGSRILVVGAGEAAFDSALSAADRGACTTVIMRGQNPSVPPRLEYEVRNRCRVLDSGRIAGLSVSDEGLTAQVVMANPDGPVSRVEADHIMVCIGREPRVHPLLDEWLSSCAPGVNGHQSRGLFVAGDVVRTRDRFAAIAAGAGMSAASSAFVWVSQYGTGI